MEFYNCLTTNFQLWRNTHTHAFRVSRNINVTCKLAIDWTWYAVRFLKSSINEWTVYIMGSILAKFGWFVYLAKHWGHQFLSRTKRPYQVTVMIDDKISKETCLYNAYNKTKEAKIRYYRWDFLLSKNITQKWAALEQQVLKADQKGLLLLTLT